MKSRVLGGIVAGLVVSMITVGCNVLQSEKTSNRPMTKGQGGLKLIRSDYSKGEIDQLCTTAIAYVRANLNQFNNAYELEYALSDLADVVNPLTFMAYVSTNEDQRDEGSRCETDYMKFDTEIYTNRELYQIVKMTQASNDAEARLLSEMRRKFEDNGMALSDADLEKFKSIKSELSELESQFIKNYNEDTSSVTFTAEELEGVSSDFLGRLKRGQGGKYVVTTKTSDYTQVMDNAKNPETRRRMLEASENRAGETNTALLERAILLRQELAKILGYANWADYRTRGRMAKSAANASDLMNDLRDKLKPRLQKDLDLLLEGKKADDPNADRLEAWDIRYYTNQVKKKNFSLDDEEIRQYFPKDTVMKGVFEIYETILGVKYEEVEDADVWHPDVKLYKILDADTDQLLAYFYTDYFPRPGKFGHAGAFPLIAGRVLTDGSYSIPVAAIVSNFEPPTESKPSLLRHDEVDTLFHEFGHIMHAVLTTAPFGYLSGTNVAQDFVEAPSQMLENWTWDAEILSRISGHFQRPEERLPADLISKMISVRDYNVGYYYSRQIVLSTTDLLIHTASGAVDANETYKQTHREILGVEPLNNSRFMASFNHLMSGYDAGYYGYIWSEVYAADMFTAFQKHGLLDPVIGASYRNTILESGNLRDPLELVTAFLGRAPNNEAFLKMLGISP